MQRTDTFEKTLMLGKIEGRGEGDDRGWDGWVASSTQWTWVWVGSGSWWWTGRPGVLWFSSVQFSRSDLSDSLWLHGLLHARLPVHNQLPELTQTHVHLVGHATQPSHPLSSSSPTIFNHSQHQGLFQWVSAAHQVTKVLEFQLQWIFRTDFL